MLLILISLVVACGKPVTEGDDAGVAADVATTDVAVDTGPAVVCPVEGNLFCGEKCIDVSFDLDHCGSCGNSCTRGKMTCMMGECLCLGAGIMCDGECYDGFTSREHCGSCGESCSSAEACVDGSCRPIAEDPEIFGVLVATNEARGKQEDCGVNGIRPAVGPVQLNEILTLAAQGHAEDMAANNYFEHQGLDGRSPAQRAADAGYNGSSTGENIARGQADSNAAVASWVDSDPHCVNMMNGDFDELGVGYAVSATGVPYWVQLFGSR